MVKTRSFLKWAGSKYNCLEKIVASLPSGSRLIEPFSGSGVVFMNTTYKSYLLAESNSDLIQLFSILQQQGLPFIEYCADYFTPENNTKEKYYDYRAAFNKEQDVYIRAALFLYLNRHGYNGLCRYNSTGGYNVPFGLYSKPYFPRQEMTLFHQKSKQAQFICSDFRATMRQAKKGDIIYCDPPYVPLFAHTKLLPYTQKIFSEQDQIELAQLAKDTAARGIPVIISNHDTEFTREYYQGGEIKSFPVIRHISCQIEKRRPARELIAVFG